jgi:hypothetical protein
MNPKDKIPALKNSMPNDPVVDILDDLCKQTGFIAGRMDSVEAAGMTLRYTRVLAFFIIFVIGMMAGGTIARSHYEKPDSLAPFQRAGVHVIFADDGDDLLLTMRGHPVKDVHAEYDDQKRKVGFTVVYGKEPQP